MAAGRKDNVAVKTVKGGEKRGKVRRRRTRGTQDDRKCKIS